MYNQEIREEIKQNGVKYWQIADVMGIHPTTLTCKLRKELPLEEKLKILQAVRKVKGVH